MRIGLGVRVGALVAIAVLIWFGLWNSGLNRVRYDTLWYAAFTYEDAGLSREAAWARSWDLVAQYGSSELMASLPRTPNGSWFDGWDDPSRARWIGIYAMRPAMPLLGAAAFPLIGTDAPVAVSLLAVILTVVVAWLVLGQLIGLLATVIFLTGTVLNPLVATWLTFLMPDGLGLGLWLLALACAARYVASGRWLWAVGAGAATLVLAFDRPSAILIPAILGAAVVVAVVGRGPWRRFALATAATGLAVAVFTAWTTVEGYPSFRDFLEDLPTRHFARADVAHPVAFMLPYAVALVRDAPGYLAQNPLVALVIVLGVLGLVVGRRWWTLPFVLALAAVPLLALGHPVATEIERTIAPIWLSVDLGLGLLAAALGRLTLAWFGNARNPAGDARRTS